MNSQKVLVSEKVKEDNPDDQLKNCSIWNQLFGSLLVAKKGFNFANSAFTARRKSMPAPKLLQESGAQLLFN